MLYAVEHDKDFNDYSEEQLLRQWIEQFLLHIFIPEIGRPNEVISVLFNIVFQLKNMDIDKSKCPKNYKNEVYKILDQFYDNDEKIRG